MEMLKHFENALFFSHIFPLFYDVSRPCYANKTYSAIIIYDELKYFVKFN